MTFALLLRVTQSVDEMTAAARDLWEVNERLEVCYVSNMCPHIYPHVVRVHAGRDHQVRHPYHIVTVP